MHVTTDGATLHLTGDFDVRTTREVRDALHRLLSCYDDVVVDLSEVRSVDVTALKVLAAASHLAAREDQRITLRGCNGAVRRMLHLTHLIRLVAVERVAVPA